MNSLVISFRQTESEINALTNRENEMLREELERLNSILMERQNEYDVLVAKYYEETNQANSRKG